MKEISLLILGFALLLTCLVVSFFLGLVPMINNLATGQESAWWEIFLAISFLITSISSAIKS